jgi:hypothetical protein
LDNMVEDYISKKDFRHIVHLHMGFAVDQ